MSPMGEILPMLPWVNRRDGEERRVGGGMLTDSLSPSHLGGGGEPGRPGAGKRGQAQSGQGPTVHIQVQRRPQRVDLTAFLLTQGCCSCFLSKIGKPPWGLWSPHLILFFTCESIHKTPPPSGLAESLLAWSGQQLAKLLIQAPLGHFCSLNLAYQ